MRHPLTSFLIALIASLSGCAHAHTEATREVSPNSQPPQLDLLPNPDPRSWVGVYSSTSEIGGFTGTVLVIEEGLNLPELRYRMSFYTDASQAGEIHEKVKTGWLLTNSAQLYVPEATGYTRDNQVSLSASITRYTRVRIRGRVVLLRDDALGEYRDHNRLYDYGVLIQVSDRVDSFVEMEQVRHESIRTIQPSDKPWRDPFVAPTTNPR